MLPLSYKMMGPAKLSNHMTMYGTFQICTICHHDRWEQIVSLSELMVGNWIITTSFSYLNSFTYMTDFSLPSL